MNAVCWIESHGVRIKADGAAIILEGLAALGREKATEVVTFARLRKDDLLEELGRPSGLPARACKGCGRAFLPTDENKVYCQAKCFNTPRK